MTPSHEDAPARLARLIRLEADEWRPHRLLSLLSFVLGDRVLAGDASRYVYEYARRKGYDLPPYPLAGCGEIRSFFADEKAKNLPDWYERKLGIGERAYARLPAQTIVAVRDARMRRQAFFLEGLRYRRDAGFAGLLDSGVLGSLSEDEAAELLDCLLAFLLDEPQASEVAGQEERSFVRASRVF